MNTHDSIMRYAVADQTRYALTTLATITTDQTARRDLLRAVNHLTEYLSPTEPCWSFDAVMTHAAETIMQACPAHFIVGTKDR